ARTTGAGRASIPPRGRGLRLPGCRRVRRVGAARPPEQAHGAREEGFRGRRGAGGSRGGLPGAVRDKDRAAAGGRRGGGPRGARPDPGGKPKEAGRL
ncbi:MAG: hypothetical protein AVDCRST_MAG01-01-2602, partial [uncultured Rubrobacteraceae bacterium]